MHDPKRLEMNGRTDRCWMNVGGSHCWQAFLFQLWLAGPFLRVCLRRAEVNSLSWPGLHTFLRGSADESFTNPVSGGFKKINNWDHLLGKNHLLILDGSGWHCVRGKHTFGLRYHFLERKYMCIWIVLVSCYIFQNQWREKIRSLSFLQNWKNWNNLTICFMIVAAGMFLLFQLYFIATLYMQGKRW